MKDNDDAFANISGTNGILGTCDTGFVLDKRRRSDRDATFSITGRDVRYQKLRIDFHDHHWWLIEKASEKKLEERDVPPVILAVIACVGSWDSPWEGTAINLLELCQCTDVKSNVLTKCLNQHRFFLLERSLSFSCERTAAARFIRLEQVKTNDGHDD